MKGRGLRGVLQPGIYLGIALSVHIVLLFAPIRLPQTNRPLVRGVKVRTFAAASARPAHPPPVPPSPPMRDAPAAAADIAGGPASPTAATQSRPSSPDPSAGPEPTEFGKYLAKLRSESVQGWAKDSARASTRGLAGSKSAKGDWAFKDSADQAAGARGNAIGSAGASLLDPRVQMVVTSYPPTGIERRHGYVTYPDRKFKKHEYASGWWNVFVQIRTDARGNVVTAKVLRPDTDGPLQRIFIRQVQDEIARWTFDPVGAEINVDVRFYVE